MLIRLFASVLRRPIHYFFLFRHFVERTHSFTSKKLWNIVFSAHKKDDQIAHNLSILKKRYIICFCVWLGTSGWSQFECCWTETHQMQMNVKYENETGTLHSSNQWFLFLLLLFLLVVVVVDPNLFLIIWCVSQNASIETESKLMEDVTNRRIQIRPPANVNFDPCALYVSLDLKRINIALNIFFAMRVKKIHEK